MDVFAVVATLVCIAVVILACIKKYNVLVTLLVMGFVGFACATVVTGGSVAGDKSDGFVWFDVFEKMCIRDRPVAEPEHRDAQLEDLRVDGRRILGVHAVSYTHLFTGTFVMVTPCGFLWKIVLTMWLAIRHTFHIGIYRSQKEIIFDLRLIAVITERLITAMPFLIRAHPFLVQMVG